MRTVGSLGGSIAARSIVQGAFDGLLSGIPGAVLSGHRSSPGLLARAILDKELFTDFPEGSLRQTDILTEVFTLEGEPELILVHIEVQARRESDFAFRMWEYYSLLRFRHRKPIFPVVVYLAPGAGGLTQETYSEGLFGREIVRFQYGVVGLPDLEADEYLQSDNELAPALAALMKSTRLKKAVRKFESLRRTARCEVDDARKLLLGNVIERYLRLTEGEQADMEALIAGTGAQEVEEMISVYEERGIIKGKREMVLRQMSRKFGSLPQTVVERIRRIEEEEPLDLLSDRILTATTLEDMQIGS